MKKFLIFFSFCIFMTISSVYANNIYHGIDIDEIESRAWSVGVAVQDGRMFHGPCHLRLNLALPKSRVEEAFRRLSTYVFV